VKYITKKKAKSEDENRWGQISDLKTLWFFFINLNYTRKRHCHPLNGIISDKNEIKSVKCCKSSTWTCIFQRNQKAAQTNCVNIFQHLLLNTKSENYWFLKQIMYISDYLNSFFVFNVSLKILHNILILLTSNRLEKFK